MNQRLAQTGYLHPQYAEALREWGEIRWLSRSGGWLLCRPLPNSWPGRDALAGYRHLFCLDWTGLAEDLGKLDDLISVTAVPDPLGPLDETELRRAFPDLVRPYKVNHVIDLNAYKPSAHHLAEVRRARQRLSLDVILDPTRLVSDWAMLYAELRDRHAISGLAAFSRDSFARQFATPGCVVTVASQGTRPVSMSVWYQMGEVAHYHLGASNSIGYRTSASYALVDTAVEYFRALGVRWLNLGSSAGIEGDNADGLSRFKRGWTTVWRQSYLCGRILDMSAYQRLVAAAGNSGTTFFPAYRTATYA